MKTKKTWIYSHELVSRSVLISLLIVASSTVCSICLLESSVGYVYSVNEDISIYQVTDLHGYYKDFYLHLTRLIPLRFF